MPKEGLGKCLGLAGIGYWGKNLARNFHQLGVLHTLCDSRKEHLETFKESYPDLFFSSGYSALLSEQQIRCIALATPPYQHFEMAKQALLAGKDVYVEKPLCMLVEEAEELVALAEQMGQILMVGHLLHYHPSFLQLLRMVQEGVLGELRYIVSNRTNLGNYRREENALWNFAPHDFSMILALAGNVLPTCVRAFGGDYLTQGVADLCLATLDFPGSLKAHVFVSWLHPFKEQKLTVIGEKGMVVFEDTKPWGQKLLYTKEPVAWDEKGHPYAVPSTPLAIDPPQEEPLANECRHFLQAVEKRSTPRTDGNEGLRVLQVLEAAQRSLENEGETTLLGPPPLTNKKAGLDPSRYAAALLPSEGISQP